MGKRMNEKIKSLADQASLIEIDGQTRYALPDEFIERFADLLLTEAVKELQLANILHCCGTTYDYGVAGCTQEKMLIHLTEVFGMTEYVHLQSKYLVNKPKTFLDDKRRI